VDETRHPDAAFLALLDLPDLDLDPGPPVPEDYSEGGFWFEARLDAAGSVYWLVTPQRPFEVDGIQYEYPGCHARWMIELVDDGCDPNRQRWDTPATEAELDRYVRDGVRPRPWH